MNDDKSSTDHEVLAQQLKGIEDEVARVRAALSAARKTRLLIFLAFLGLLCAIGIVFYNAIERFRSPDNVDKLVAEFQKQMGDRSGDYLKEIQTLVENSRPVLTEAFYEQAQKDAPKYLDALDEQREVLVDNLQVGLEQQINEQYGAALKKHQTILVKEFPDIKDNEVFDKLSSNLETAIQSLLKKYYSEELEKEFGKLFDTWESFPPAETPARGEAPLEDQLVGNLLELVQLHISRRSLEDETLLNPLGQP
jgi:Skp family chaperone for outer membrane proteins